MNEWMFLFLPTINVIALRCLTNKTLFCRFALVKNTNANYIPMIFHYERKFNEPRKANNAIFWYAKTHIIHDENKSYHQSSNNHRPRIHWTRPHHNALHHHVNYVHRMAWHATQIMYNRIVCSKMSYVKCVKITLSHANFATKMLQINWAHETASAVASAFNIHP